MRRLSPIERSNVFGRRKNNLSRTLSTLRNQVAFWATCCLLVLVFAGTTRAQVAAKFDATLHKELASFSFGKMAGGITYNGLSSPSTSTFTIDTGDIAFPGDDTFGGMGFVAWGAAGWNLDVNDDPNTPANQVSDYLLEIKFKPLVTNAATNFNVNVRDWDGFDVTRGQLLADDHQFTVFMADPNFGNDTDNSDGVTSTTDPNGFITWRRDVVVAPADFVFSSLADLGTDEGDRILNLNAKATPGFVNDLGTTMGTPILGDDGGMRELQIQSPFGGIDRLHIEVQSAGFVPKTPGAEKARFDFRNTSFTFDSFLTSGAYTQNNASNNIEIDADGIGGAGVNNASVNFDGTTHSVQITARVLGSNTAGTFAVNLKDIDGDDSAAGGGGELYQVLLDTTDFVDPNGGFVTITVPVSSALLGAATAFEFVNTGDGSITDFNLYQIQVANINDVTLTADFDGSGTVDAADLALWEAGFGVGASADADGDGDTDGADFLVWQRERGTVVSAGRLNLELQSVQIIATPPLAAAGAVPEPGTCVLALLGMVGVAGLRRNRFRNC